MTHINFLNYLLYTLYLNYSYVVVEDFQNPSFQICLLHVPVFPPLVYLHFTSHY